MSSSLLNSPVIVRSLAHLAAGFIRVVGFTSRFEWRGLEPAKKIVEGGEVPIFAFWHNRFTVMPLAQRRKMHGLKMAVMVSNSRDGELLAGLIGAFGFYSARGSSSRGGRKALLELVRLFKDGYSVAVTPDGPRGPRYQVQEGVIALSAITGAPLIPVSFASTRCLVLRGSWDHMRIPLPLGRIRVVFSEPLRVPRKLTPEDREKWCLKLRQGLLSADEEASEVVDIPRKMSCPVN